LLKIYFIPLLHLKTLSCEENESEKNLDF